MRRHSSSTKLPRQGRGEEEGGADPQPDGKPVRAQESTACPRDAPPEAPLHLLPPGDQRGSRNTSLVGGRGSVRHPEALALLPPHTTSWALTRLFLWSSYLTLRPQMFLSGRLYIVFGAVRVEGHGNPLQYSCLETPTDTGGWWVKSVGVQRVGHD